MSKVKDIIAAITAAGAITGANAQSTEAPATPVTASVTETGPAPAVFASLKGGIALTRRDMDNAIAAARDPVQISPDKQFAIVIDKAKGTFAALKLANEDGKTVVDGPLTTYQSGAPEKSLGSSEISYAAALAVTQFTKNGSAIGKILADGKKENNVAAVVKPATVAER